MWRQGREMGIPLLLIWTFHFPFPTLFVSSCHNPTQSRPLCSLARQPLLAVLLPASFLLDICTILASSQEGKEVKEVGEVEDEKRRIETSRQRKEKGKKGEERKWKEKGNLIESRGVVATLPRKWSKKEMRRDRRGSSNKTLEFCAILVFQ